MIEDGLGVFWHLAPQPGGEGPLGGMTLAVKDNVDVAGMPTTAGFAGYAGRVAAADAPCVARLRKAGCAILGKVAMHEGALGATTDVPRLCHNPLRHGFTPGGSSGGSGAAIAAGFAELAIGTDTMGSVRIPAAYCGVVGLKPTRGLVSRSRVVPLSPTLDHVGMLARTPRMAARGLAGMAGDDPSDPSSRPLPLGWRAVPEQAAGIAGLHVGLPRPVQEAAMEAAVREAWERAAQRLRDLGAQVAPVEVPAWSPGAARRAGLLLIEAEAAAIHQDLIADPTATSPGFRAALQYGRDAGTVRMARALFLLSEVYAGALRALDACDVLLMPTAPQRAFAFGTATPADQADFTALANIAGLPAIAFPWPAEGLPASVQLVGRAYAEAQIVAIAEALSAP
ncbi:amidase [Falsiroseomonas sp.]|uniref:amidase n=1 Tax=Falsiroseomonas sp. TaxID=2870721 RepID=UPI0035621BF9